MSGTLTDPPPLSSLALRVSALSHLPACSLGDPRDRVPHSPTHDGDDGDADDSDAAAGDGDAGGGCTFNHARTVMARVEMLPVQSVRDELLRVHAMILLAEAASRHSGYALGTVEVGHELNVCGDIPTDPGGIVDAVAAGPVWARAALAIIDAHQSKSPEWLLQAKNRSNAQLTQAVETASSMQDGNGFPNPVIVETDAIMCFHGLSR